MNGNSPVVPATEIVIPVVSEISFPKKEPDKYCNGKIHRQNRYCHRPAGWGTSHVGSGRCKLHGGCSTGRRSGLLRYADFVPSALTDIYNQFADEEDVDVKSLDDEIALIRGKMALIEERNDVLSNVGQTDMVVYNQAAIEKVNNDKMVLQMAELVRRLIETKQKVEEGIKSKVTIEVVVRMVDSVIAIIDKHVTDIEQKKRIAGEMRRLNISEMGIGSN